MHAGSVALHASSHAVKAMSLLQPFRSAPTHHKRLDCVRLNATKRIEVDRLSRRTQSGKNKQSFKGREEKKGSQFYFFVTGFPFPLGPLLSRPTVRVEVEKDRIWMFEQEHSLALTNVVTNIRMTIIKLSSNELWVHAPIAPTEECVRLVEELGYPVRYIILPTFAYEHKVFVGPFSRKFPDAEVYTAPKQWSWPIQLPPQAFGIFTQGTLKHDDQESPWADEIEQKVFSSSLMALGRLVVSLQNLLASLFERHSLFVGFGPYSEVAFLHKPSKTLLVTDAVVQIGSNPPDVVSEKALQKSGERVPFPIAPVCKGDNGESTPAPTDINNRRGLGWMRIALLILYFVPYDLLTPQESFNAVANKLFVSPVVRTLVFTKASRNEVRAWVNSICDNWNFEKIIPAHFDAPIKASPADFKEAFSFLFDMPETPPQQSSNIFQRLFGSTQRQNNVLKEFPFNDMRGLRAIEFALQKTGVVNRETV